MLKRLFLVAGAAWLPACGGPGAAASSPAPVQVHVPATTAISGATDYTVKRPQSDAPPCPPWDLASCEESCLDGQRDSCVTVASAYLRGIGVWRDVDRGGPWLVDLCDQGVVRACYEYGADHARGRRVGTLSKTGAQYLRRALKAWQPQCDRGDAERCWAMHQAYHQFDHILGEPAADAQRYFTQALANWTRRCEARDAEACAQLAKRLEDDNQSELARRACDYGSPEGCCLQALTYDVTVPEEAQRALQLLRAGCERDHLRSCYELGNWYRRGYGTAPDPQRAVALHEKVCRRGLQHPEACEAASIAYLRGDAVTQDVAKSIRLRERGCLFGLDSACMSLAQRFRDGDGVEQDAERARKLVRRYCDLRGLLRCNPLDSF